MPRRFALVNTLDDDDVSRPRDTANDLNLALMLTKIGLTWAETTISYQADSAAGTDLGPDTVLIGRTRPELGPYPVRRGRHNNVVHPRNIVPHAPNCPLLDRVSEVYSGVYADLDGTRAIYRELARPECDGRVRTAARSSYSAHFSGRLINAFRLYGKNGCGAASPIARGRVSSITFGDRPRWEKSAPIAAGQLVSAPSLAPGGPAYFNASSWTRQLTYQFHQLCCCALTDLISDMIHSDTARHAVVLFRPMAQQHPNAIVAIGEGIFDDTPTSRPFRTLIDRELADERLPRRQYHGANVHGR